MKQKIILLIIFLSSANFCLSSEAVDNLLNAKTLKCIWDGGVSITLDPNAKWVIEDTSLPESIIDNIDLEKTTARMIGNAGSADINVYKFAYGLIFTEGSWNYFHTISIPYKTIPDSPEYYPAFYNRHVSMFGDVNSNLYGRCKVW